MDTRIDEEVIEAVAELRNGMISLCHDGVDMLDFIDAIRHVLLEIVLGLEGEAAKAAFIESFMDLLFADIKSNMDAAAIADIETSMASKG